VKNPKENEGSPQGEDKRADCRLLAAFEWTEERSSAAIALAQGKTQKQVAQEVGVPERTQRSWLAHPDFAAEVDRLSLMVDVSSRAGRLRIAMRAIRQAIKDDVVDTNKDVLEWLKFAQSETDGVKLDITKLAAALGANEAPVADSGQTGVSGEAESETIM
jgi:hypothetical protein